MIPITVKKLDIDYTPYNDLWNKVYEQNLEAGRTSLPTAFVNAGRDAAEETKKVYNAARLDEASRKQELYNARAQAQSDRDYALQEALRSGEAKQFLDWYYALSDDEKAKYPYSDLVTVLEANYGNGK